MFKEQSNRLENMKWGGGRRTKKMREYTLIICKFISICWKTWKNVGKTLRKKRIRFSRYIFKYSSLIICILPSTNVGVEGASVERRSHQKEQDAQKVWMDFASFRKSSDNDWSLFFPSFLPASQLATLINFPFLAISLCIGEGGCGEQSIRKTRVFPKIKGKLSITAVGRLRLHTNYSDENYFRIEFLWINIYCRISPVYTFEG